MSPRESVIRAEASRFLQHLQSRVDTDDEISLEMVSGVVIYSISQFIIDEESDSPLLNEARSLLGESHRNIHMRYSGDSTLFEVGCFAYFIIDEWLRENSPRINLNTFHNALLKDFIRIFDDIYDDFDFEELYKERYLKYLELSKGQGDLENCYPFFEQLIYRTEDDSVPTSHAPRAKIVVPFPERLWIKLSFVAWHEGVVPGMLSSIKLFTDVLGSRNS